MQKYAERKVAKEFGCRVPWMEPREYPTLSLCGPGPTDKQVMLDAVGYYNRIMGESSMLKVVLKASDNEL